MNSLTFTFDPVTKGQKAAEGNPASNQVSKGSVYAEAITLPCVYVGEASRLLVSGKNMCKNPKNLILFF